MDVNNNAWYFTGEIDYKKIPLIQKCKNIIVKCSVTTNFEVDNIISYLHNICSSGEMKTLDLREFYLPSGIYSIGYCSNIEKIILPQGESRISYCKNLKEIVLPQNSLLNITETNHNISLTKFVVEYGHKYYCVKNDALYSKDGRTLLLFPTNKICNYKLVYVNSESSNLNENAFYNSVVDNFILPVNYINPQFIKIPWEQQSVFVGFICFLYEDNGIHYGLIRSEKRTFVRFKYKPQEEKFEIGNVVTYEYKKRYSKHFNGNNIVYTLDNANQGFNVLNLNYKPENKDKDSSEILLEYIKNDYWYKQGHKSKNYILSNEIISEYFKKKDYIGLQRKISAYVQQYDIKKACEQYFVTIEEDFRYRVGRDDYYSCCEVGKIEKYSTDTYIQKILPKYGKCLYEDKGYMAADKMAIDTTGYKEEASIKQIQIRNNALKYYNPICHEHELYEEILSDYISEQKENEYLLEKLFHYNTLVNYGKSYFSHDDLEKVRMDFMSFASHIL